MKRILITGGTGLLGTALTSYLKCSGHEAFTVGRNGGDFRVDATKPRALHQPFDESKPNVVINLAALTNVDQCEKDPHSAYKMNVAIVEQLVKLTRAQRIPLIHISTDHIYDGPGNKEESDITIKNMYAFSKYCGEKVAEQAHATILRTNFFGKSQLPQRKSFSDWLYDSMKQQQSINLFSDIFFSPLSIDTLCKLIERVVTKPLPGTFNLGSWDGLSKAEFALAFARELGLPTSKSTVSNSETVNLLAARPKNMLMDCSFFERTYDITLPKLKDEIVSAAQSYAKLSNESPLLSEAFSPSTETQV